MYEARVRSCAVCNVNGREEQLWSAYSSVALCRWEEREEEEEEEEGPAVVGVARGQALRRKAAVTGELGSGKGWNSAGIVLFAVLTFLTILAALILGQVAV